MKHPAPDVAKYLLPAVNALIACELVKKRGLRQSEVARIMDVSPAAVTQYLKRSRGWRVIDKLQNSKRIMEIISSLLKGDRVRRIDSEEFFFAMREICLEARREGIIPNPELCHLTPKHTNSRKAVSL